MYNEHTCIFSSLSWRPLAHRKQSLILKNQSSFCWKWHLYPKVLSAGIHNVLKYFMAHIAHSQLWIALPVKKVKIFLLYFFKELFCFNPLVAVNQKFIFERLSFMKFFEVFSVLPTERTESPAGQKVSSLSENAHLWKNVNVNLLENRNAHF